MANPLIKLWVMPPTNSAFPASAILSADGARLYFDTPSNVSSKGPAKTISFASQADRVPVKLSTFPDRDSLDEDYTLTITFTDANGLKQTNTFPVHVVDQDLQRTNPFAVTVNFDRDLTGFFTNQSRRASVKQAAPNSAVKKGDVVLAEHSREDDDALVVVADADLVLRHQEVRAVNTICNDTEERQADARALAREVDAIVVVGGKNSANTRHLAEICRELQPRTWHVETEAELRPEWFAGCRTVGLSAGASTPDWVVEGVAGWLRSLP